MARPLHAQAQKADGAATQAQGCVPPPPIATGCSGREVDQPGAARLGELLCGGTRQRVLRLRERLGGEEDPPPYVFSPGICWSGLSLNRWGCEVHALQTNS